MLQTARKQITYGLLFLFLWPAACNRQGNQAPYPVQKYARARNGMVVSAHPLATAVGVEILKAGGNAADAVIAVQLALAVVYPRAGNLGGGGFLVYRNANGEIQSLDYREKAPRQAKRDMYLDSTGHIIPGLSLNGILASGVPGTVAGLVTTHRKYGRLQPWSRLVDPAIRLAREGFRITAAEAEGLNHNQHDFSKCNPYPCPFISARPWKAGDLLTQPDLANTLQAIADQGAAGFYGGRNAALLDSFSRANGGMITLQDLQDYQAVWREPFHIHWRDYDLYTMGLPSSGGILLSQILTMVDPWLLDSLGYQDVHNIHAIVEAERRAYADRAVYLGDADYVHVPVDSLLAAGYLHNKMKDFNPDKATVSKTLHAELFTLKKESFETTHISVADAEGNAAAVTTTLNDSYGSKVWVPGGGYLLNNEMDDFSAKPGAPNMFGLIGGEANAIAPGKRMLSSMTPTIVEQHDRLYMVLGSPGGSTIPTTVLQVFLNKTVFRMGLEEAVGARRYHHQWLPDEILLEQGAFPESLQKQLSARGHHLRSIERIGLVEAIWMDDEGVLHGVADPRAEDHASGW